jgi:anti-sigma regulatory factor (Ser/Thr protein kinase)
LRSSIKKEYAADLKTVPQMMEFIEEMCEGLPAQAAFDLTLCSEEVLMNIAGYAYQGDAGRLTIDWGKDPVEREITVVFEDSGIPFNPLLREEPDLSVPMKERKIGGLGIMMVRKRMDTVSYSYANGKNILTVSKKF